MTVWLLRWFRRGVPTPRDGGDPIGALLRLRVARKLALCWAECLEYEARGQRRRADMLQRQIERIEDE